VATQFDTQVTRLREAGAEFSGVMNRLLDLRASAKLDPPIASALLRLLNEGASIKQAVRTTTQMIDGAKRWFGRTFQADAMETIPFAPEVVATASASSVAAIEHFLDKARALMPKLEKLRERFEVLPEEKRTALAGMNAAPPVPDVKPALILLAILGGLIWWINQR